MQVHSSQSILAYAKDFWGYIGPLIGLILGSFLTTSSQRRQWLLDRRKDEFRELISAMTHATIELQHYIAAKQSGFEQPWHQWLDAHKSALRVVADRIYIASDLKKLNIPTRYLAAVEKLRESNDPEGDSAGDVGAIIDELVKLAQKG